MFITDIITRKRIKEIQKKLEQDFPNYKKMADEAFMLKKTIELANAGGNNLITNEICSLASDIAFLSQDAVNRMARCRQALIEKELTTAGRHSIIAEAQIKKASALNKVLIEKISNNN